MFLLSLLYKNRIVLESHKSPDNFLHRKIDLFLLKKGANLVVTSQTLLKAYQKAAADEKLCKNITVIRNGSSDYCVEKRNAVRDYTVGYVGGVSRKKGLDFIIQLAKQMPHVNFVLVGPIRDGKEKLENTQNILTTGHVRQPEIKAFYKEFNALIAPYPDDGNFNLVSEFPSPLKISEYFSTGLPIIASRNSATDELLESGVDGILLNNDISEWSPLSGAAKQPRSIHEIRCVCTKQVWRQDFPGTLEQES